MDCGIAACYEVRCSGILCRRAATKSALLLCSEQQRHSMPSCSNEVCCDGSGAAVVQQRSPLEFTMKGRGTKSALQSSSGCEGRSPVGHGSEGRSPVGHGSEGRGTKSAGIYNERPWDKVRGSGSEGRGTKSAGIYNERRWDKVCCSGSEGRGTKSVAAAAKVVGRSPLQRHGMPLCHGMECRGAMQQTAALRNFVPRGTAACAGFRHGNGVPTLQNHGICGTKFCCVGLLQRSAASPAPGPALQRRYAGPARTLYIAPALAAFYVPA